MTLTEAQQVFRQLFIAFPHMHRFLNDSTDAEATLDQWCKMLARVEYGVGLAVVDRWKSGDLDPPDKPWELGMLPAKIRAVAGKMADERAKQERLDVLRQQSQQRNGRSGKDNLAQAIRVSMAAGDALKAGAITEARNREIVASLKRQTENRELDIVIPDDVRDYMKVARNNR